MKKKEAEEELVIQGYAKQKERMEGIKKAKAEQKFKEKLDVRQKLIEKQCLELQQIKDKENERLNQQVMEAEIKAERALEEKRRKMEQQKEMIEQSRKL
jgi:hypothetical protein